MTWEHEMVIEPMIHCLDEHGVAVEFRSYAELFNVRAWRALLSVNHDDIPDPPEAQR